MKPKASMNLGFRLFFAALCCPIGYAWAVDPMNESQLDGFYVTPPTGLTVATMRSGKSSCQVINDGMSDGQSASKLEVCSSERTSGGTADNSNSQGENQDQQNFDESLQSQSELSRPVTPPNLNAVDTDSAPDGAVDSLFGVTQTSSFASLLALGSSNYSSDTVNSLLNYQNDRFRDQIARDGGLGPDRNGSVDGLFFGSVATDLVNALLGRDTSENRPVRDLGYFYVPILENGVDIEVPSIKSSYGVSEVRISDRYF